MSLNRYSALRRWCRTKSSAAAVPKFERDAAPHAGLPPLPDSAPPRAVSSRPVSEQERKERALREPPRRIPQQQRHSTTPWSSSPRAAAAGGAATTRTPPTAASHRQITIDDFFHPPQSVSGRAPSDDERLPSEFTSPPLLPALRNSLMEKLGPFAHPTPIQSLSIKYLVQESTKHEEEKTLPNSTNWRQFFLASETGSGKSIAYLLPLLQSLKQAELLAKEKQQQDGDVSVPRTQNGNNNNNNDRLYNPRALILAPTHELTRQLSGFAKSLLHQLKLRVLCASQANSKNTKKVHRTSRKMLAMADDEHNLQEFGCPSDERVGHGVDVMVGTPMKMLELVRGRGWDKLRDQQREDDDDGDGDEGGDGASEGETEAETEKRKPRRGRDFDVGFGRKVTAQLGLQNVEWVVIDEADVLLDSDFQATTRLLLSDISAARDHPVPLTPAPDLEGSSLPSQQRHLPSPTPISYPFNFILTSATIPNSLNTYLSNHHPSLIRLSSPHLHHLPKSLAIEYVAWSGGNKFADIHRRIRQVWAEDAAVPSPDGSGSGDELSRVLIFCNKTTKATELSVYLGEQGVDCVPMTSASRHRVMGTNRHLFGFLKGPSVVETLAKKKAMKRLRQEHNNNNNGGRGDKKKKADPLVMVTTSLLSRGLDFSPEVKHVFIVDEPRNMIDFLHRAGRAGRAGQKGKVVVFGKLSGRGGERGREVRKRVVNLRLTREPQGTKKMFGGWKAGRGEHGKGQRQGEGETVDPYAVVSSFRKGRPYFKEKNKGRRRS